MVSLLGSGDELLRVIEDSFDADIHVRGNEITISGSPAETAVVAELFEELTALLAGGAELTPGAVERIVPMLRRKSGVRPADVLTLDILSSRGRTIRPKTLNQKRYVDAIDEHTIVFCIGPAGTGKTYLAMAKAVKALQAKEVTRIILTRPAVEAGERLGFLPGSVCPHYDGEERRRPVYQQLVADGLPAGIAVEDSAGIFYEETVLKEVVAEVDGRRAYRVELADGKITETVIPTRSLVSPPAPAAPPPPPAPQPQAPPAPR